MRKRVTAETYDPDEEFDVSPSLNMLLKTIMHVELLLIRLGIRFPIGGSRLLVAQKRT